MGRFSRAVVLAFFAVLMMPGGPRALAAHPPFSKRPLSAETPAEFYARLKTYIEDFKTLATGKPDPEQLKKLIAYATLSEDDKREYDEMFRVLAVMSPAEWLQVVSSAQLSGQTMFMRALDARFEESTDNLSSRKVRLSNEVVSGLPASLRENLDGFIESATGVLYSKHVAQGTPRVLPPGQAPIILGGGFPFNQTQFVDFNDRLARLTDVDLYDPLCNGMSVLFDAVLNDGRLCRPYKAATPKGLLRDEVAVRWAHFNLYAYAVVLGLDVESAQDILFRITRLAYKGITLAQQAKALAAIAETQGYRDGEAILSGISYGGMLAAKVGAMFPGRYRALVLFSPGVENSAHAKSNRIVSAALEGTTHHRRVLQRMVTETAFSPRYDAYRPVCLKDYDRAFRDSLVKKMLGELDMNIRDDLERVSDPVFMFTGVLDAAIDPKLQIDAMRTVFKKPRARGSFVLVPKGGHALWGNPAQQAETAVLRGLEEILKGSAGAFEDGGVYVWNEARNSFDDVGQGLDGLVKAEALIDWLKAEAAK